MVFAKNEDGGILPQSRRVQRNAAIAKGYAEANKNYQAYSDDLKVLKDLNKQLDNNGQAITDNEQRMAKANEATKNASQRAKDYGKQIATNAKTLTDFKRENEVEKPDQQKQGKWSDGLKSMASAGLSMIGNAFISAGVGMLVQGAFSLLGKGIDAFVHKNENLIAKGQEAKESIQSQTKAYEDQKASLGELTSKYTELSKGVKISGNSIKNISLTDDEYKDFLDTSNQIAAAAPSLTRSWDSQGNAILNAGTNAEDLNTQVNDYLKLQRNLTYYDTKKNISDQYKGYETALGENKSKQDEYKNAYDAAKYKVDSVQKFSDMLKKHTKGEDTITYTLDQTAYDALGNTFGKAIKGYKQSADGQKITLEFDGKQLDFLRKWANRLSFSVTIDGNKELHDSCRVFPDGGPSYDIAVDAASDWMKRGNHMGSKITIAPGNISFLYDAIKHMVDLGYDEINANCVYEKGWTPVHATVLYDQMKRISDYFLEQNFDFERDFFCSLYNEDFFQPKDPDDLQSWCGGVGNSMIACDPQGRIFPCIRYMESSLNGEQEPYSIGDVDNGIGCTECYKCRINCMAKIDRRTQSTDECFYCPIAAGCSNCSGYDYQVNGTPDSKATYICVMHKARALGNLYFWNKYYRKNNMSKRMKNYVPDEWALEIISESELNMLKELERED